jgi:hypothetical protein
MMEDTISKLKIIGMIIDNNIGVENQSLENKRVRIEKEIIKIKQAKVRRRKKIRTNSRKKLNKALEIKDLQINL